MCLQNPSASSPLASKFGSLKTLRQAIFPGGLQLACEHICFLGPLRISGTTSRLDCSRQLRRYVAQLGHTVGVVKPGGGMNMWKRPLLPSGQLSRPGRLVKALEHHTMQPNEMPDMQCTMLVKKPTRRSMRILTPSLQKSTTLLTS